MHGFKDDFSAWKSTLSADEQALILKQAQGEFNKKFRKSDDFSKDIASDKIESFAKVLKKFFDSEREDYKKDKETKTPDYNVLQRKAQQKTYDFSLKQRIVEVNRDAYRRYMFATEKARMAEAKGEKFPSASPLQEIWLIQNNDTDSHQRAMDVMDFIAKAKEGAQPESAKMMDDLIKKGVPAVGQDFELLLHRSLWRRQRLLSKSSMTACSSTLSTTRRPRSLSSSRSSCLRSGARSSRNSFQSTSWPVTRWRRTRRT